MVDLQEYLLERIKGLNEEELRNELKYIIEMISAHELADIYVNIIDYEALNIR